MFALSSAQYKDIYHLAASAASQYHLHLSYLNFLLKIQLGKRMSFLFSSLQNLLKGGSISRPTKFV